MKSSRNEFTNALKSNFSAAMGGAQTQTLMQDLNKFSKEMKEDLEGGKSDKKTLLDLAIKHAMKDKVLTTGHKINSILGILKSELKKGLEVEKEHTDNEEIAREIAMDHLAEDPHYYTKLKKMENNEQIIRKSAKKGIADKLVGTNKMEKPIGKLYSMGKSEAKENVGNSAKREFAKDLQMDKDYLEFKKNSKRKEGYKEFNYGVPNVTVDDPYIKKTKYSRPGKEEATEATSSGSSGAYSAPLFGGDNEFIKKSDKETPKLEEGIAVGAMGLDKVEATEATSSSSVGGYSTPAMWAKSTKKKDWGPSRKTQYKGGQFVQVKKKCTKFPYCNQGDINALKLSKNESVQKAIKEVSKKHNISEDVIKTILEYEYSKIKP